MAVTAAETVAKTAAMRVTVAETVAMRKTEASKWRLNRGDGSRAGWTVAGTVAKRMVGAEAVASGWSERERGRERERDGDGETWRERERDMDTGGGRDDGPKEEAVAFQVAARPRGR